MITGNYVSAERVIEEVLRDFPFTHSLNWLDALEWIGKIIGLMGVPQMSSKKIKCVTIEDYRGSLPEGMLRIDLIRSKSTNIDGESNYNAMRYDGNPFMKKLHCDDSTNLTCSADITYQLNDGYIFTSFETGEVEIACDMFPIDDRGYPMIPDDEAVISAAVHFIAFREAFKLWSMGNLPDKIYAEVKKDKDWYVGKAISRGKMLSKDQMESWKNMVVRLIPKLDAHSSHFSSVKNQEQRYNHNTNNLQQGDQSY